MSQKAEITVVTVEDEIENALVKQNVTDTILSELKEFKKLKLASIDDKEGYLDIKEKRKKACKLRLLAVEICKKGREDAIKTQKAWKAKEDEIVEIIKDVESHLSKEEDIYEAEKERIKQEKIRIEQANLIKRQAELLQMGAQLVGDQFVLGDVSIDIVSVKEASDASYASSILPDFKEIFDRNEAARIKKEKDDEDARLAQEAEKKRIEEAAAELKKAQDELKAAQDKLKKDQEDADNEKKRIADQEKQKVSNERGIFLKNLGFTFDFSENSFHYNGEEYADYISIFDVQSLTTDQWEERTKLIPESVAKDKESREEKQRKFVEEQTKKAVADALQKQKDDQEAQKQKEADDAKQAAILEQEKSDKATDSQKWVIFADSLQQIKYPEMKSSKYRKFVAIAKEKIEEIMAQ